MMLEKVDYWLQAESTKNFGDYLSEYFLERLFALTVPTPHRVRIVGSCIDDAFLPPGERVLFWGCGLRTPGGLSEAARPAADVLSVRGPLTRSHLRLGANTPIGDPALLLPCLHAHDPALRGSAPALLVPHYHDQRSDAALLALSGCTAVLRPNIVGSPAAVEDFLGRLAEAEFVLAGAMHAAIAAAAYGTPFGFWDSGTIDLPFKWEDFAASIAVPCRFHATLALSREYYAQEIAGSLRIPPLWPMLVAAPFPVRPDVFVRVLGGDVARHGAGVLTTASTAAAEGLRSRLGDLLAHWRGGLGALNDAAAAQLAAEEATAALAAERHDRIAVETAAEQARAQALRLVADADAAAARAQMAQQAAVKDLAVERELAEQALAELQDAAQRAREHSDAARTQMLRQAAEIARLEHERRDMVGAGGQDPHAALTELRARYDAVIGSSSWRALAPLRQVGMRAPWLSRAARRVLRLAWWTASGQVFRRLRQRRRVAATIGALQRHALFDAGWYVDHYAALLPPGVDALAHYAWTGIEAGLDPHPLFDGRWYRASHPALPATTAPVVHYIQAGAAAGMDPHPLFDTQHYLAQPGKPPPANVTPLEHYLAQPADSLRTPNRLFDQAGYRFDRIAGLAINPLVHYVTIGEAQGFEPHPAFDPAWYATRHPDRGGLGPLAYALRGDVAGPMRHWPETVGDLPLRPLNFAAAPAPQVSIIVPVYGAYAQTYRCLLAVMTNTAGADGSVSYEVILADDHPASPITPLFAEVANLRREANAQNLGFLRNCNRAAARARGAQIVFLNNDTLVGRNWLQPLLALLDDPSVGMVGCKLLNMDGTVQEAGGIMLSNGWGLPYGGGDRADRGAYNFVREVDVVTGACFAVRAADFAAVGGFDDRYAPAFYEEFDLAIALRERGLRTLYQPSSQVVHLGSASYGTEQRDRQTLKNHAQFVQKWQFLLPGQPGQMTPAILMREHTSPRGVMLVIDDKVPEYDKHAGAVTLFQYLNLMQEMGLKVIYHPFDGQALQPYTDVLQQRGIEVLHAPDTLAGWLDRDGLHVDFIWVARPDVATPTLDLLRRTTGARIMYYTHDLHYLREARRFALDGDAWAAQESTRLKPLELAIFAAVDRVMTPSGAEAAIIRAEVPHAHVTVVPPYLFPTEGAPDPAALDFTGRNAVIFVGGFDHLPNVDAALWLATEIMPLVWRERPSVDLLIVGNAPPPQVLALAADRVEVTGFVPTLEPYYARARAAVSPLRYGAGVKGKIVGSLRAGVPVVTTSVGNEGIGLAHGMEALIADDAVGLARAILALFGAPDLCQAIATAGMTVLDRQFSKERARAVLLDLLGDDTCPVCGARPRFPGSRGTSWREQTSCTACGALNRTAALAEILLRPFREQRVVSLRAARRVFAKLHVHEFGFVGPVQASLAGEDFTVSDFFPGVAPGETAPNGVRCEDLQALTFADASFDLAISQDVMEHVPDMERAWREIYRVLRPGGRHVFTIPYSADRLLTIRRAELVDGVVHHILPPEYHGDPIRQEGALAFWDYGADLSALLRQVGFVVTLHAVTRSGETVLVFEAVKPGA